MQERLELQASPRMVWEMSPFMAAVHILGTEVLLNMKRKIPNEESEIRDLEDDYKEYRGLVLIDGYGFAVAKGRNKSGKGSLMMGLFQLLTEDLYLREQAQNRGIERIDIITVPFVQVREAVKLPEAPEEFRIPPDTSKPEDYTPKIVSRISRFQWFLINNYVFPSGAKTREEITGVLKREKRAMAVLVEESTPLVYPKTKTVPVEVEGIQDLGSSCGYNFAFDQRSRENLLIFFTKKGEDLSKDKASSKFRHDLSSSKPKLRSIFGGDIRVVYRKPNGEEIDVTKLPKLEKMKIAFILGKSMASPSLVKHLDRQMDKFEEQLLSEGKIHAPANDDSYADFLSGLLWLPKRRFIAVSNPQFDGQKTYYLNYLLDSLVAKIYPQILSTPYGELSIL